MRPEMLSSSTPYILEFPIFLRQQTHEVTNAAAGFQNVAGLEAQIGKPLIHGANYHRRGVERRQGGFPGGGVFVLRKQSFQLAIMGIGFLKELGQAAPAYILRENVLFIRRGQTVFRLPTCAAALWREHCDRNAQWERQYPDHSWRYDNFCGHLRQLRAGERGGEWAKKEAAPPRPHRP